jgi:hypothetical protein
MFKFLYHTYLALASNGKAGKCDLKFTTEISKTINGWKN